MKKEKIFAVGIAATVALGAMAFPAAAKDVSADGSSTYSSAFEGERSLVRRYKSLFGVQNKSVWSYSRPGVSIAGKQLSVSGLVINGEAYIPFRAAAGAIEGSSYNYDSKSRTSEMRAEGLVINAGEGCYTVYANDRALFTEHPVVIMSDGRMYIPAQTFAKAVGMSLSAVGGKIELSGKYSPIAHASSFYREDEVFWLARIIHAESRGEPLLGKIAVGDVVLNRVRSAYYPNTIYGLIFDRKYGTQFSPVSFGTIYQKPTASAVIAAKICLEGYSLSDEVLFFLNPRIATNNWIVRARPYAFTIGNHDFYN